MDGQNYSQMSADAALKALHSGKKGLAPAEAARRLAKLGPNTLQYSSSAWLGIGIRQLARDSFFLILLIAELAAWYLGDGHIMLAVGVALALNILATAAFLRHSSNFIVHLERMLQAPVTITRSGLRQQIEASELIPGDIVHVSQGETIPADLRLISTEHLVTDEFNISGNNQHIAKAAKIGVNNIALFGTAAIAGSGSGVVIARGDQTAFGTRLNSVDEVVRYTATPTLKRLEVIKSRIGKTAAVLLAILIIFALATHTTLDTFLLFVIVLAVALVPISLATELAAMQHAGTAPITWAVRCAASDAGALLLLAVIGIIGQTACHVPMAITAVQIIAVSVVALMLPITGLSGDRPKKVTASAPVRWLGFALVSAAISYANFLLFFERQGISPRHLDTNSTLYFHAATLGFVTIALCRLVSLIFVRSEHHEQFFTRYLLSNKGLLLSFAASIFLLTFCIYYPPLRHYFDIQPLSIVDWLTALAATALFFSLHLLQRHTRKHTREAVLELHKRFGVTEPVK